MKILYSTLLVFLFIICAVGQKSADSTDLPKVEVIKSEWNAKVYNSLLDQDPFEANNETKQAQQDEIEYLKQTQIRAKMGLPPEPKPVRVRQMETQPNENSVTYIYELKIKNTGTKEIGGITWDYVFLDSETKQEVGRQQFISKVNIEPGKIKNVSMRSASPPTGTINAKNAGKKQRDQYLEQIFIQTIQYTDGSVWTAGSK